MYLANEKKIKYLRRTNNILQFTVTKKFKKKKEKYFKSQQKLKKQIQKKIVSHKNKNRSKFSWQMQKFCSVFLLFLQRI